MTKEMFRKIISQRATMLIALLWIVLYIVGLFVDIYTPFEGKGLALIDNEFFRFITGPMLHFNVLHLAVNVWALLWLGYYLEPALGSMKFAAFALLAGSLSELCYCAVFQTSQHNIGGSVWIFALFGLIIASMLQKKAFPSFIPGSCYGRRLIGYAVLGNLPLLSFCTVGTVITHAIALTVGFIIASIGFHYPIQQKNT